MPHRAAGPEAQSILQLLPPAARGLLSALTVLGETDSTQEELRRVPAGERHGHAVLAQSQRAGQGRRGRRWHSPAGDNVYLSLGWRLERTDGELSGLPLVVALAAARAVRGLGLSRLAIKWPNDLVLAAGEDPPLRKLGGCLVELQPLDSGARVALLGIGLNVRFHQHPGDAIDQPWTDLASHLPGQLHGVSRDRCAAALLGELTRGLAAFERFGFEPWRAMWPEFDALAGREVLLEGPRDRYQGLAQGLGPRGGLLLATDGATMEHLVGDVSLRLVRQ